MAEKALERITEQAVRTYLGQRGTGKSIPRQDAIVYDFMPVILGEQFRTQPVLSRMLLREAPVDAPFMLTTDAYEALGLRYLSHQTSSADRDTGSMVRALECYRIALDSRIGFTRFVASIDEVALLTKREIAHLSADSPLEKALVWQLGARKPTIERGAFSSWVEDLRVARKRFHEFNHKTYGSAEYVEACLRVGAYEEALYSARTLKKRSLVTKVLRATPKEILDVQFLRKYIDDNHPESSMFR